ncbi:TPA: AraC family transcriptional regulator [Enterobacter asburiae]|nr:AraC family transcriptional regulator [Enterobacter asburiae]
MTITDWLLAQNRTKTSIYHLGKYCGDWKASTYPQGRPSFHFILSGECWLDVGCRERTFLEEGDVLFFFKNIPFYLTSSQDGEVTTLPVKEMTEIDDPTEGTSLLCGFLNPESVGSQVLFALLPEFVLVKKTDDAGSKLHLLFELLKKECRPDEANNDAIVHHLTEAILFYVVGRDVIQNEIDINLLQLAEDKLLAELIIDILEQPEKRWSLEDMSSHIYMSRSTFIRRVIKITGYTPNHMLSKLRIIKAINLLRLEYTVEEIACKVGYDSLTGFYRAFKRVTGLSPNSYRELAYASS